MPQKDLDGAVLQYDRGKGLRGSTAINFCAYNIGPKEDLDEIARLVGDDEWKRENAQKRYKKLESYYATIPESRGDWKTYLNPKPDDHGADGMLKIGFPRVFEKDNVDLIETWAASGHAINPDTNSGITLDIAATPMSAHRGIRTTAADLLHNAPPHLTGLTNTQVAKALFSGSSPPTVVGIETVTSPQYIVSNEVVLSAGALDTPKLLMLSGIGPAAHLEAHSIPLVQSSPAVGQNLRDHFHTAPVWVRAEHTTTKHTCYASPRLQAAAREQWQTDQTGPLSEIC